MQESCIVILIKKNAQIHCRGLAAKVKKQTCFVPKIPSNWRPTWIQQMKLAAISCRGMTEYARFEHQKKSFGSTKHNRIHSCSFKSRMPTNTACLHRKRTLGLFDADPICYRNCCGIEQSITTSTPLSKSQFSYGKTPEDGTWVLILYSEHMKFFLQ